MALSDRDRQQLRDLADRMTALGERGAALREADARPAQVDAAAAPVDAGGEKDDVPPVGEVAIPRAAFEAQIHEAIDLLDAICARMQQRIRGEIPVPDALRRVEESPAVNDAAAARESRLALAPRESLMPERVSQVMGGGDEEDEPAQVG